MQIHDCFTSLVLRFSNEEISSAEIDLGAVSKEDEDNNENAWMVVDVSIDIDKAIELDIPSITEIFGVFK